MSRSGTPFSGPLTQQLVRSRSVSMSIRCMANLRSRNQGGPGWPRSTDQLIMSPGRIRPIQDDRAGDTRGQLLQLPAVHVDGDEVRSGKDPPVLQGRQLDSTFRGVRNAVGRLML